MNEPSLASQNRPGRDPGAPGRIAALNDALRRTGAGGRVILTAGVAALPRDQRAGIVAAVQAFEAFDPDNDPHGEHDFGLLRFGGHRVMFKVDAYDPELRMASPDPAVTCRVLTIMLAEEY